MNPLATGRDELVRRLIGDRFRQQPRSHNLYLNDAGFHAAVEHMSRTLHVTAEQMSAKGVAPFTLEMILRASLVQLIDDAQIDGHDSVIRLSTSP